jgi:type I restriction enzyme S subunit
MIANAEKEVARLEKMKIASLQKMFPRPGQTTPEIRFGGFTEPWIEKRFSDVYMPLKNNTLSRDCLNDNNGIAQNIHYGDVLIRYKSIVNVSTDKVPFVNGDIQLEISKSNLLINGDVVFADTAEDETVGKCTEISGVGDYAVVSGLHTIPVRPKFEFAPLYLGYFHNSESYHTQLLPLMQGVKVLSVSKSAIADTLIYYPTSIEEQKLIGEYFNNLDCIIEAKRDRIVKLRNIKKACLEKMFVNNTTEQ